MGVVPARSQDKAPTPPERAPHGPRLGFVEFSAALLLAIAGMAWWTMDRLDCPGETLKAICLLLAASFVMCGAFVSASRRPVPRLPWKKRAHGKTPDTAPASGRGVS